MGEIFYMKVTFKNNLTKTIQLPGIVEPITIRPMPIFKTIDVMEKAKAFDENNVPLIRELLAMCLKQTNIDVTEEVIDNLTLQDGMELVYKIVEFSQSISQNDQQKVQNLNTLQEQKSQDFLSQTPTTSESTAN